MMMDVYKILIFFILDTGCQKLFSSKRARPICAARWRKAEVLHIQGIIEVHAAHLLSWNRRHKQARVNSETCWE